MFVAAAVATGVLAARGLGYLTFYNIYQPSNWVLTLFPLLVALIVALTLTWSFPAVMLAVGLTEVLTLVVFLLELTKDYLMMRNVQAGRR